MEGKTVAKGCGCGCFSLLLVVIITGVGGTLWLKGKLDSFKQEFVDMGMKEHPTSQVITITESPSEPTFYVAQVVKIETDLDVEIGIIAQTAEINGVAAEKVYFRGQMIQIGPNAHLRNGLNVFCQVVQGQGGTVEGGVTGPAQVVQPDSLRKASP